MFKKSFVSLFFTPQLLQVLQLSSSKKKVRKLASIELPSGLILNGRVQDTAALVGILKNTWKKLRFGEKTVGIVIPEFSTFTKNLLMPKMEVEELNEAVNWEAQDFLPGKPAEMVVDWKIVKEATGSYQVLAVAVRKDLLKGYVDAVAGAGLYPLVVETPSLSLIRIAGGESTGRLIIYNNFGETILTIAEGETILGSSVVPAGNYEEIIKTSSQIISHFRQVKVQKIVIGGVGIAKELFDRLGQAFGRPVDWIKPKVRGLSSEQSQQYLIPMLLQLKDPAEPADEKTVNLLPPSWVKRYEHNKLKVQIWSLTLIVSYVVWVSFFATLGVYLFLGQEAHSLRAKTSSFKTPPGKAGILEQINEINKISDKVLRIDRFTSSPHVVFNAITKAVPGGVTITRYKFDFDSGKIELSGISADRQALIDFKQALEEGNDFSLVEIPISSFESVSDLEFNLAFVYLPVVKEKGIKGLPAK